jgi:hypothetical protein
MPFVRGAFALSFLVVSLMGGAEAAAQTPADVERIAKLGSNPDFRVRTQAALALGATKQKTAVAPLCRSLSDANTTVRAAAAAALGKLKLGGTECLKARIALEQNATAKAAMQKSLAILLTPPEPVITPETKFYLAIAKTTDKSGRTGDGVDRMVRGAMEGAAPTLNIVLAPVTETQEQGKKRLSAHPKLKAFYFSPRVAPIEYVGGNLKVKLEIAFFTYPEKAMIGTFTVPLTQEGVDGPDPASEDDLLKMAAARALEKFAPIAARLQ